MHSVSCGPQRRNDPHRCVIRRWAGTGKSAILFGMNVSANDLPDDIAALKAIIISALADKHVTDATTATIKTENLALRA